VEGSLPLHEKILEMRIIQLIQKKQRRGAEIFAAQLSNELTKLGHQLLIVAIFNHSPDLDTGTVEIRELGRPLKRRNFDPKGYWQLSQLIRAFAPDIVQANAGDTLKYAALSKLLFPWKGALVYRNANQMGDFITSELQKYLYSKLLSQVDAVASVSQASKENFKVTFPKFQKEVAYLPIGIPIDQHTPAQGLPDFLKGKKYLLQVGGLVREKNPLFTLKLFESLAGEFSELELVFVGSGPLEKQLKEKIGLSPYQSRIHLLPNQPSVREYLGSAYALLMPSAIEGLPAVILEAMLARTLVVAYDVGGISEVVKNKETGFLISRKNEIEFKDAVVEALKIKVEDLDMMINNAYQFVNQNYNIKSVTDRFEDFYRELL
jgi:glycosyltransferase involved in cell wall biosynthesis